MATAKKRPAKTKKRKLDIQTMQDRSEDAAGLLKSIGSQNRLLLLCQMVDEERSVNDLSESLDLAQSVVSQHLSVLRRDKLIKGRREGQSIYYSISDHRVHALMETLFTIFCADD
ncbi:metalloregulator ArsR/SmtB family transcription factor [Dyella sp. 2HG41-7]|uniref:ArsR/SmtB family transcription factor n=1 Tax=Dyella sp. 2HG41-7 TaxID=2883239 RepID=UPI001F31C691|nr:metalloregulator ArsR/SmtB family transcription factor [Dyella sp. 2HG41-7]